MAQVKIIEEGTLFKVVDAETGFPVLPSYYRTLRGARQAATKAGHSYGVAKAAPKASQEAVIAEAIRAALAAHGIVESKPAPAPAPKKKEEAPKSPKTWESSRACALGYTKGQCQEVFDFLVASHRASGGDWKAGEAALIAAGHTPEGVWSAFRAGKAMRAARVAAKKEREASAPAPATARKSIPPVVDAGILPASKREEPATAPAPVTVVEVAPQAERVIDPLSEVRNSLAKANGFKRYRSIRRASERGDARATALLAAIRAAIAAHEVTLRGLSPEEVASKNEQFLRVMGA